MKKLFILLISLLSLTAIGCSTKPDIILTKNAKLTVDSLQNGDTEKSFYLLDLLTQKERYQVIEWMQNNPEKIAPFYYMYFADDIFANNKDEAVFWYFIGRIRATEDVQMCQDKTASAQIGVYPLLAPKTLQYMSKKNDKYHLQTIKKAIIWDEKHTRRVSPIWSCYHGLESFSQKPRLQPIDNYEKIQKQTRQGILDSLK